MTLPGVPSGSPPGGPLKGKGGLCTTLGSRVHPTLLSLQDQGQVHTLSLGPDLVTSVQRGDGIEVAGCLALSHAFDVYGAFAGYAQSCSC